MKNIMRDSWKIARAERQCREILKNPILSEADEAELERLGEVIYTTMLQNGTIERLISRKALDANSKVLDLINEAMNKNG